MKHSVLFLLFAAMLADGSRCSASPPTLLAYVLQADSLANTKATAVERLAACRRDWIVLDARFDVETPLERDDLDAIRRRQPGRRVIAYLSIGEAENYRPYWRKEWIGKSGSFAIAPAWLGEENPQWQGNYRVKYWHAEWQKLILAALDDIMACGSDGVYLDIVDGFQTFEREGSDFHDDRLNAETKQSYRRDMVDWVKAVAARARAKNHAALVIPQNGSQLLSHADFLESIDAIGIEDLFTNGDRLQSRSDTAEVLGSLEIAAKAKKPVLLIEYPQNTKRRELSKRLAKEHGMTWLLTDRQLKILGESGR